MKLSYSKDRLAEAKEIRSKWYKGEKIDRLPFQFSVPAPKGGWIDASPYSNKDCCTSVDKAVEAQIMSIQHQLSTYPDCDYLPFFRLDYLGEGLLPSMYGAKQMIDEKYPPFTEGRVLKDIYELDKLPLKADIENSEWGKILKEHIFKFIETTNGEIPVSVIDHQSPYGIATKLMPNEELILAMYDEPELVHKLFSIVTEGIMDVTEKVKEWIGEDLLVTNSYNPIPKECGIILWDDYVSVISPKLYREFCIPYNTQLYNKYGYGHLHTCGPYFPGYIDGCIQCKPRSMDISIMRGMGKSKADLMEFRKITAQNNILLFGNLAMNDKSVFDPNPVMPDFEMILEFAKGGYFMSDSGTFDDSEKFMKNLNKINSIIYN